MITKPDITIHLPAEHFTALLAVIYAGLKHASIKNQDRRQLEAWWQAESELIRDEIDASKEVLD